MAIRHFLTLRDYSRKELEDMLRLASVVKKNQKKYGKALSGKTLLMMFAKPSLRTRLSFEEGMIELGGHAIHYDLSTSPFGKKESPEDTGRIASLYVDCIMARLFEHSDIERLASGSTVPVINGLTNFSHPCQVMADLMTIKEHFGTLKGIKVAYVGDSNNNVTHSLLFGCSIMGLDISIGCPGKKDFMPNPDVVASAKRQAAKNKTAVIVTDDASEAVRGAHVVYTDSWMSYHIPDSEKAERLRALQPYQVNTALMKKANKNAVFMHCLPAERGMEVTADVIDGKQSIVVHQAENRLHFQKGLLVWLLDKYKEKK
ncbi:ornithine carbamoyltransferase [Candidatus Woesearchaeota archaeon]|nr:ornithine carbamoyltransferase [Candidatus Woesearchaeota archaeon]